MKMKRGYLAAALVMALSAVGWGVVACEKAEPKLLFDVDYLVTSGDVLARYSNGGQLVLEVYPDCSWKVGEGWTQKDAAVFVREVYENMGRPPGFISVIGMEACSIEEILKEVIK